MKDNLKVFTIGFIAGVIFFFLIENLFAVEDYPKPSSISTSWLKHEKEEQSFKIVFDSLFIRNDRLAKEVKSSKNRLDNANKQNALLKAQIYELIDKNTINSFDTTKVLENCDSLAARVEDLIILNDGKDSISQSVITSLEEQILNKDKTIELSTRQNQLLRQALDSSLLNQMALQSEKKQLEKSAHRTKRNNKICKALLLIASSFVVNQILKR